MTWNNYDGGKNQRPLKWLREAGTCTQNTECWQKEKKLAKICVIFGAQSKLGLQSLPSLWPPCPDLPWCQGRNPLSLIRELNIASACLLSANSWSTLEENSPSFGNSLEHVIKKWKSCTGWLQKICVEAYSASKTLKQAVWGIRGPCATLELNWLHEVSKLQGSVEVLFLPCQAMEQEEDVATPWGSKNGASVNMRLILGTHSNVPWRKDK